MALFVTAVLTDAIDGYVARVGQQATRLGAILDPAADKLLLMASYVSLSCIKSLPEVYQLPPWVPILVLFRDLIIVGGWLLIVLASGNLEAQPSRLGKATTFFQMLTIVSILLGWSYLHNPIFWAAMVFTVLSGVGYLRRGNRDLNFGGRPS